MKHWSISVAILILASISGFAQLASEKGSNGKIGFKDYDDNWVIQPQYDEVTDFYDIHYAFARLKNKWGVIDTLGRTVLPFEYNKITILDYYEETLYSVEKNSRHGMVNLKNGKLIAECMYDSDPEFQEGILYPLGNIFIVYKNKKAGLISDKGIELVPCLYDGGKKPPFTDLYDYFVTVRQNDKVGVLDTLGHQIIPCQYDDVNVSDSMSEVFEVRKNGKHGLYSFEGKEIIAPIYDDTFYFEGEYAIAKLKGKYGVINRKGEPVTPFKFSKESDALDEMLKLYDSNTNN